DSQLLRKNCPTIPHWIDLILQWQLYEKQCYFSPPSPPSPTVSAISPMTSNFAQHPHHPLNLKWMLGDNNNENGDYSA
ncbi:18221_t:CDS:1, partial [Funneliformis geosporum]